MSHECDHPPEVRTRPRAVAPALSLDGRPPEEIDRLVREALAAGESLYRLDEALVAGLAPDVILTQAVCDVCAPAHGSVAAFAATLAKPPLVVSLDPASLADVFADFARVAQALGAPERAPPVVAALKARLAAVARAVEGRPRPRCFVLEWPNPPYATGHFGPELVAAAGGVEVLGRPGVPSRGVEWAEIAAARPEVIVLAFCGLAEEAARTELPRLAARPEWAELPAVRAGRVHPVDGSAYFSRPGPRLVDSVEILAALLHPGAPLPPVH